MSGKEIYKKTFDEIQISGQMMSRLMLLNDGVLVCRDNVLSQHRILKGAVAFLGFLLASGVFSVPIL